MAVALVLAGLLFACGGETDASAEAEDPCTPHCECVDHTAGLVPLSSEACDDKTWIAYRPTPATWQACVALCKQ